MNIIKKISSILVLCLFISACFDVKKSVPPGNYIQQTEELELFDEGCKAQLGLLNLKTKAKNFLNYDVFNDSLIFVKWGNKITKRQLRDTFYCTSGYIVPKFEWDSKRFMSLSFSCGSPCWGNIILPLDNSMTESTYLYPYAVDQKENLIVFLDKENNKDALSIENFATKKRKIIPLENCPYAFSGDCLDSLSYKQGTLYFKWSTSNGTTEKTLLVTSADFFR